VLDIIDFFKEGLEMKLTEGQEIQFQSFRQKFTYVKDLGTGGAGRTILVKDKITGVFFAIKKFIPKQTEYSEDLYKRFIDEIITLNNVSHTNIVRIYTYYLNEDLRVGYIQMEFIDGFSIEQIFEFVSLGFEEEDLPDKLFEQAISSFCYLEKQKILHRDIRTNNLLVDKSNNLKIIDFGFGKILNPSKEIAESVILNWPATAMPEEITGESPYYDKVTEIYFLGNLFSNLLDKDKSLNFSYKSIISKMIKIRREDRYNCFADIQMDLSSKLFKNIFTDEEKEIYADFANVFSKILVRFDSDYTVIGDLNLIINNLKKVLENNILEKNIQNNEHIVDCFLECDSYRYSISIEMKVSVFENFLRFISNATPFKQNLIISNISNRIKKTPIKMEASEDLPF